MLIETCPLPPDSSGDRANLSVRARQTHARRQASERFDQTVPSPPPWTQGERLPDVVLEWKPEIGPHHADDACRPAVQPYGSPEHVGGAAEAALPQVSTDQRDVGAAICIAFGEHRSNERCDAEDAECRRRDACATQRLRRSVVRSEADGAIDEFGKVRERTLFARDPEREIGRQTEIALSGRPVLSGDVDDAVTLRKGEVSRETTDDAEDRRRRCDPKGDGQRRRRKENALPRCRAQTSADIDEVAAATDPNATP